MSDIAVATVLAAAILLASMLSVELAVSVALIELALGVVVGNAFSLEIPSWLSFIGAFAGIVLTFLAGAEVDVPHLRREWRSSLALGLTGFAAPFLTVFLLALYALDWTRDQSEIAGLALSTTSIAVVYAVLVESGLNATLIGKRVMSATFVTGLATVAGLSILFATPTVWIVPFAVVSVALILGLPRIVPWFFGRYGDRVIEPEIKLVFACLFLLWWLGDRAGSQAVLPAFLLGLAMSGHYDLHRLEQERLRVVAFAFLTPFFFLKGGMSVSAGALWANVGVVALLFAGKLVPKLVGVYPLARRYTAPHEVFATLLLSTGLTFGTIAALYGLNAGIIDRTQFSLLIAVVVLSAIIPAVIAQRFFQPDAAHEVRRDTGDPLAERPVEVDPGTARA